MSEVTREEMSTLQSQVLELTKQLKELTVMVCSILEDQRQCGCSYKRKQTEEKVQGG